ncbi:MAG: hypothetical protein HPPSJP_0810 [Candidatus Hepatoplasma scabrum]|nr:MAG: hypothetical protein HPPSJP_0810 [Candidatus Hepatoplasma sp.]
MGVKLSKMVNKNNKNKKNFFSSSLNTISNYFKNTFKRDKKNEISLQSESFENSEILNKKSDNFDLLEENTRLSKIKNKILSEKKGEDFLDENLDLQTNTAQFLFENIFETEKLKQKLEELNLEKKIDIDINDKNKKSYSLKFDNNDLNDDLKQNNNSNDSDELFSDFEYENEISEELDEDNLKKNEINNLEEIEDKKEIEEVDIQKKNEINTKFPFFLLQNQKEKIDNDDSSEKYQRKINYILRNVDFPGKISEVNSCSTFSTFVITLFKNFNIKDLYKFKSHFSKFFYKIDYRFDINKINQKKLILEIKNPYFNISNFKYFYQKMNNDFIEEKLILGQDYQNKPIYKSLSKLFILAKAKDKTNFINNLITSIVLKKNSDEIKFKIFLEKDIDLKYDLNFPFFFENNLSKNYSLNEMIDIYNQRKEIFKQKKANNFDHYNNLLIDENERIPKIILVISELKNVLENNDNSIINKFIKIIAKGEKYGIYPILLAEKISNNIREKIDINLFKNEQRILFFQDTNLSNFQFFKNKEIDKLFSIGDFVILNQNELIHCQQIVISDQELKLINIYLKNFYNLRNKQRLIENNMNDKMNQEDINEEILDKDDFLLKTAKMILSEKKEINLQIIQSYMGIDYNQAYLILRSLIKYKIISDQKNNNNRYKLIDEEVYNEVEYF